MILEKRLQSEDRAHRIGQKKSVTYVDLIAPKTVDEKIRKALRKKINIAKTSNGRGVKRLDLIILNDGLYQLIPVTKEIMEGIVITAEVDCFDLCNILREKLSGYVDSLNLHIMNDGSGNFVGCICR